MSAQILVVDDALMSQHSLGYLLEILGHEGTFASSAEEATGILQQASFDVILSDLIMPGMGGMGLLAWCQAHCEETPFLVMSSDESIEMAIEATRQGAYDYLNKPISLAKLTEVLESALQSRALHQTAQRLRHSEPSADGWCGLVGQSPEMLQMYRMISRAARFFTPVLVIGESGTGKELIARAVHDSSPRAQRPFVAVNGAGIVEGLFESLMFGHRRGSFTGASADQRGLFEEADGGTLFLDEVGEMSLSSQARLLRVLETSEILPVGAARPRKVDVRLVSATNRDLVAAIAAGQFREDLYYRICGVKLTPPPLRERGRDIATLSLHFLRELCARTGVNIKGFAPAVLACFEEYSWPGNVRELRQVIESAAVISRTPWIELEDLPPRLRGEPLRAQPLAPAPVSAPAPALETGRPLTLAEVERRQIEGVLALTDGNRSRTAALLGVSRHTLYRMIRKHGIDADACEELDAQAVRSAS